MSTVYASPIWLGRPHCPVIVTTGAGAVVTAALGSLTLTATADANGLCAMKLPRRGRWSFTAVLGGKKGFGMLAVPGQRSLSLPLYSTTLAENSWAEIAAAAAAGIAARLWSPGDVKELTISGTAGLLTVTDLTIGAIILGFDHNAALRRPPQRSRHRRMRRSPSASSTSGRATASCSPAGTRPCSSTAARSRRGSSSSPA